MHAPFVRLGRTGAARLQTGSGAGCSPVALGSAWPALRRRYVRFFDPCRCFRQGCLFSKQQQQTQQQQNHNTTTTKPQHNNNKTTTQQQQSKTTKTCRHEWRHGTSGDVRHFRIAFEECYAPAAVRRPAVAGPSLALWALNLIEGPLAPIVYDFGFLPRGEPQGGALQTFFRHEKTGSARLEPPRLIHLKSARGGSPTKRRATRTVLAKQRSC